MVMDAFLRRYSLLSLMETCILGFQVLEEFHKEDEDVSPDIKDGGDGSKNSYIVQDGFLFIENELYILKGPIRKFF